MGAFFDEVFEPFYSSASKSKDDYCFGQLFWTSAYYPHQRLDVWRPNNLDARLGTATDFNIKSTVPDIFRKTSPYYNPPLKTNEEFIAIKGKQRPVLLLQPPDPKLLSVSKGAYPAKIARHLCPVALVFSAEDDAGNAKYPPDFIDRVRRLEYQQFLFLPKGGPLPRDSIARLDEVQSVAENQLQPTGYCLSAPVCDVVKSQVSYFLTGLSAKEFADWAALLR